MGIGGIVQRESQESGYDEVMPLVIEDLKERYEIGKQRYGSALQPFNGRSSLIDAYQEALDLVVYLRNLIEEQKILENDLDGK